MTGSFGRAVWVIAYRELLRYLQERSRLVSSFAMPLIFLVVFGLGLGGTVGAVAQGVDFAQFVYPGIIAMSVVTTALFSGLSVVWDREFGFLKEVLVAPLSRGGVVLGKATGGAVVALLQGMLMLVLAPALGVDVSVALVLSLVPLLMVLALALAALGLLVASRMRSQQGFQVLTQVIVFPLIFMAGVFFPVQNAPEWMQVVSKLDPLTYGVDAIRQAFLSAGPGTPPDQDLGLVVFGHAMTAWQDALVVAGLGTALMLAAMWAFSRQG